MVQPEGSANFGREPRGIRHAEARLRTKIVAWLGWIAVWGPGLLVMLADTDAGNVVTAAQAGARWGLRLLPLLLLLIPLLYMVQELTVRLGIYTGRGHGELIRERFGARWAWLSLAGLASANYRFSGHRIHRSGGDRRTLWHLAQSHFADRHGGAACRRRDRLLPARWNECAIYRPFRTRFLCRCLDCTPEFRDLGKEAVDLPLGNREFLYIAAADYRSCVQSMDDLLPTIRCRR